MFVPGNLIILLITLHGCIPTKGHVIQYSYVPNPSQYPSYFHQQQQSQQQPSYIPLQLPEQNINYEKTPFSIPSNMPSYIPRPPDVVVPPRGVRESAEPSTTRISKTYYSCFLKDSPFTISSTPAFIIADTENVLAYPSFSASSTTKPPYNPSNITSTTTQNPCVTTTTTPKPNYVITTTTPKPNCVTTTPKPTKPNCVNKTTSSSTTHQPIVSTSTPTPTTQKPPVLPTNNTTSTAETGPCSVIEIISDAKQKINNLVTNTIDTRNHQIAQIVRNSLTKVNNDEICKQATSSTSLHYTTATLSIQSGASQLARKCMGNLYEPSNAIDQTVQQVEKYIRTIPLGKEFSNVDLTDFRKILRNELRSACDEVNTCHAKALNPTTPIESEVPENFVTSSCNSFKSSYTKMVDEVESLISNLLKDHSSASNNITSILEAKITCTINNGICTVKELLQDKAAGNWSGIVDHTHGWIHHFQNNRIQAEKEVIVQVLAKVLRNRDNLVSFLENEQQLINSHMNKVVQSKAQKCAQCEYSNKLTTLKKNLFDKLLHELNPLYRGIWGDSLSLNFGISTPINEFFDKLSEGHRKFQASFADDGTVNNLVDGACRPYMDQIETHQANLLHEMETYSKDVVNSQVADIDPTLPHKPTVGSVLLESFKKSLGCNVTCEGISPTQTLSPTSQTAQAGISSLGKKPVTLIPCKEEECHKRFAIVEIIQPGPMAADGGKYFSGSDGKVYQYASTDGLYPTGPFVGKVIYQWEQ